MLIHTECLPDETLLKKIGFGRKQIQHHQGKSRILSLFSRSNNLLGMIDEDPASVPHPYQARLTLDTQAHGLLLYKDHAAKNKLIALRIKLEDWIVAVTKQSGLQMGDFKLPANPHDLHAVLNARIPAFENLLDALLERESPALLKLRQWTIG